jgi:hypothetical protein
MTDTQDFWKPFGEPRWRDFAETAGASELQLKFAVARFNGASAAKAAEIAGYSGDKESLRGAGYSATRSEGVVGIIELAEINAPDERALNEREIDAKVAKLVRSPDPNRVKAGLEIYEKRKARQIERGQTPEDDGFGEWRICRDFLGQENGATAFIAVYKSTFKDIGHVANLPLLYDVHAKMKTEPMGQAMWDWSASTLSGEMQKCHAERLSNPDWQKIARKQIWAEIGREVANG